MDTHTGVSDVFPDEVEVGLTDCELTVKVMKISPNEIRNNFFMGKEMMVWLRRQKYDF
jgi:hypothetical protein